MIGNPNLAALREQAEICRKAGSPLTGAVLDAAADVLDRTTRTGARILGWTGDAHADALALRFTGALHAIVRHEPNSALADYYRSRSGDLPGILRATIAARDPIIDRWLDTPPQTNEVGRSAVLMAGLLAIAGGRPLRVELNEIGSSAGLNLNLDRFAYNLGGTPAGDPASPVRLAPEWEGPPPLSAPVTVVDRAGVDLQPLDPTDPAAAERLAAFVWADQADRLARVEGAIAIARAHPPQVARGDAADWLEERLARPQQPGVTRVLMHSVVWPYLPDETKQRITAAMEAAGASASEERPLAWVQMEGRPFGHRLRVRRWPGAGDERVLAEVHPHGAWVKWVS